MNKLELLRETLSEGRPVRLIEEDIYSVLDDSRPSQYDSNAKLYDLMVGSRLYNRVMWGASPDDYRLFAARAVASCVDGTILDAGCGSLLFTERAYMARRCPIIACDHSLDMLRQARGRLLKSNSAVDKPIVLLHADLRDLPFRANCFQTVLSMNVLHHYLDPAGLVLQLNKLLAPGGHLYLTTLVTNDRFPGDLYLGILYRCGWLVRPRQSYELKTILSDQLNDTIAFWTQGNMAYATSPRP